MKIEKLNENKIKIIFDNKDLEENQITVHSFMSNSIENQKLFLKILKIAEKEIGFITENYKVSVETLTQNKDTFTLIVSRFSEKIKKVSSSKLHTSRRLSKLEEKVSLYKFSNVEVLLDFSKFISRNFPEISLLLNGKNSLYEFDNYYFLAIDKILLDKKNIFKITCLLSEFFEFINISDITFSKLKECGNLLIDKYAINICN